MDKWIRKYFNIVSYLSVLAAFLSMCFSGTIGSVAGIGFAFLFGFAWLTEASRYRIGDRFGLLLVLGALPIFYLIWKLNLFGIPPGQLAISTLAQLIVSLSVVKLFQDKSARDWGFLFVISFFEVLLSAGSSISATFFVCLVIYVLTAIGAIVLFEISKSYSVLDIGGDEIGDDRNFGYRLPAISVSLLIALLMIGIPLFFMVPRFGSSPISGNMQQERGYVGYSNSVQLGKLGTLQQNQRIALRAEVDGLENVPPLYRKWRGIALDRFDNLSWSKSVFSATEVSKNQFQSYILSPRVDLSSSVVQSITLEALDTSNIFSLPNPTEIRGEFNGMLHDSEGSISVIGDSQRTPYFVESDATYPTNEELNKDFGKSGDSFARYRALPHLDSRIAELAKNVIRSANANTRYEKVRAIEKYLQTSFTYSLELKATGNEPLADFLFDKKAGHCEYFATAMAVMLRTQGIETRIVNGFQLGEFNETAGVFIVKQRDAHSWVEVYFPGRDLWVPFDPTPSVAGSYDEASLTLAGRLTSYAEALETLWVQYFVSYDNKNQRSLFRSVVRSFRNFEAEFAVRLNELKDFFTSLWKDLSGEKGFEARIYAIIKFVGILIFLMIAIPWSFFMGRRLWRMAFWRNWKKYFRKADEAIIIEFYERMTIALSKKGLNRSAHQTPYEFAEEINVDAARRITENYQKVRFGKQQLSDVEINEIESWLQSIEKVK